MFLQHALSEADHDCDEGAANDILVLGDLVSTTNHLYRTYLGNHTAVGGAGGLQTRAAG